MNITKVKCLGSRIFPHSHLRTRTTSEMSWEGKMNVRDFEIATWNVRSHNNIKMTLMWLAVEWVGVA